MKSDSADPPRPEEIPPLEAFHKGYLYWIKAVTVLQADAETQCERMGDYSAARELKDDVCGGKYLAASEFLGDRERAAMLAVIESVEAVSGDVLRAASGRQANLAAMEHDCWLVPRIRAGQALEMLKAFTEENARYFGLKPNAL